jgi:RNA polymerase sigma factor (sigma-70 family)
MGVLSLEGADAPDPSNATDVIETIKSPVAFATSVVNTVRPPSWLHDDAVAEALLAMVEAAARFDPSVGAPFSAFAFKWMRGRVLDHCGRWIEAEPPVSLDDLNEHEEVMADRPDASDPYEHVEGGKVAQDFLRTLTDRERRLVALVAFQGETLGGAARRIGVHRNTATRDMEALRRKATLYWTTRPAA